MISSKETSKSKSAKPSKGPDNSLPAKASTEAVPVAKEPKKKFNSDPAPM